MKIYENVVIGNFLYTLGLNLGLKKSTKPVIINLLQQTPSDKILGDVLVEYPGIVRLIEFKNKYANKDKETRKLENVNSAIKNKPEMIQVSKEIHWYIETEPTNDELSSRIVPYLDAFEDNVFSNYFKLEDFIQSMVDEVIEPRYSLDEQQVKNYLSLLRMCQGGGNVGTGGLVINITNNEIRYVQINDFTQLRLQQEEFVQQIQNTNEKMMEMEKEIEKEYTRSFRRHPGLEM